MITLCMTQDEQFAKALAKAILAAHSYCIEVEVHKDRVKVYDYDYDDELESLVRGFQLGWEARL